MYICIVKIPLPFWFKVHVCIVKGPFKDQIKGRSERYFKGHIKSQFKGQAEKYEGQNQGRFSVA